MKCTAIARIDCLATASCCSLLAYILRFAFVPAIVRRAHTALLLNRLETFNIGVVGFWVRAYLLSRFVASYAFASEGIVKRSGKKTSRTRKYGHYVVLPDDPAW